MGLGRILAQNVSKKSNAPGFAQEGDGHSSSKLFRNLTILI